MFYMRQGDKREMFSNLRRGSTLALLENGGSRITNPQVRHFLLRELMALVRAEIRAAHGHRSTLRNTKRSADRLARSQSRKVKKQVEARLGFTKRQFGKLSKATLMRRFRSSSLLDALDPGRKNRWLNVVKRVLPEEDAELPAVELRNFDLIRYPHETLDQFAAISKVEGQELVARLDFMDKHVNDAGAFLVLAEIWSAITASFSHGRMETSIQKVVSATGLDRELGVQLPAVDNHDDVWAFPTERRRPKGTTRDPDAELAPTDRDKLATRFCELVDGWLAVPNDPKSEDIGYELTIDAKGHLALLIGEVLCNAERHSQPSSDDGDWSTTAFMVRRQREDGEWELLCHMAFLSVGQSMAESLQQASPDVRKFVDGYVDMHKKCGLRRDTLETIVALQDAVTGNAEAHEATRGGFGLQDVLAFINDLAENEKTGKEAKVTILSGNACIQLSTPHLAGKREAEGEKRLHWCNVANKRDQAPDSKMVSDLKRRFAGTLVTVAFTLDNNYVDSSE